VRTKHRSLRGVIALAVIGLMAMVGATEAQGKAPFGNYDSISVLRNGAPHELVEGTRIGMRFKRRNVSWRAGCNRFGARVKIRFRPRRLLTGPIFGTRVACSDALHRQDRWLETFFRRDPRWALRGERLRLRSGDDVIRLRRAKSETSDDPSPGGPPEPPGEPDPRCELVEGDCSIYSDRFWELQAKYERFEIETGVYPYHPECMEAGERGEPIVCPAVIVFLYPDGTLGSSHWVIDPCAPGGWRIEGPDPPSC